MNAILQFFNKINFFKNIPSFEIIALHRWGNHISHNRIVHCDERIKKCNSMNWEDYSINKE